MKYHYPLTIEFIDNISSLVIILTVPMLTIGLASLLYITTMNKRSIIGNIESRESKARNIIYWFMMVMLCSILLIYSYYSFVTLDYTSQFAGALLGIFKSLLYLILSPFIFIFSIYSADNIKSDLLMNGPVLMNDVKSWFGYKFGININDVTKSTILVMVKMLTLIVFSTKIINITNFLFLNMLKASKTISYIGAIIVFLSLIAFYITSHYEEVVNIFHITQQIFTAYTKGIMK